MKHLAPDAETICARPRVLVAPKRGSRPHRRTVLVQACPAQVAVTEADRSASERPAPRNTAQSRAWQPQIHAAGQAGIQPATTLTTPAASRQDVPDGQRRPSSQAAQDRV